MSFTIRLMLTVFCRSAHTTRCPAYAPAKGFDAAQEACTQAYRAGASGLLSSSRRQSANRARSPTM